MAFTKTWQFDANRRVTFPLGTNSSLWWLSTHQVVWLAKWLTGALGGFTQGLWTVEGSSNGTAAGMDGVNRWNVAEPVAANSPILWATIANAGNRSWIVLKSPPVMANGVSSNFRLFIGMADVLNAAASASGCLMAWSKSAWTGGSISAFPTPPVDVWTTGFSTTNFSAIGPYPGAVLNGSVNGNYLTTPAQTMRLSFGLASDGSFYMVTWINGDAAPTHRIVYSVLGKTKSNDQFPVWTWNGGVYSGWTNAATVTRDSFSMAANNSNYCTMGRDVNGVLNAAPILVPVAMGATQLINASRGPDSSDGLYMDWPAYVYQNKSLKGQVQDFILVSNSLPVGAVLVDNSNNVQYVNTGSLLFPANAPFIY
jgi:hypothetical protein